MVPSTAETVSAPAQQRLFELDTSISSDYCSFMTRGFDCTIRNRSKAIGQFLTPERIYSPMVQEVTSTLRYADNRTIRIIDPFCGDGRLIAALIRSIGSSVSSSFKLEAFAWDIDGAILAEAEKIIEDSAVAVPFDVEIHVEKRDAFECESSVLGTFDVCITNPPWSSTKSLKPNAFASKEEYRHYQDVANDYGKILSERFPEVRGGRSFGAGALNLSRFGFALAMRLISSEGICAIVMPSSFAADTSSMNLRKRLIEKYRILSLRYYPAELKQFDGADQAAISLLFDYKYGGGSGDVVSFTKTGADSYHLDGAFLRYSADNGFLIPLGYSEDEVRLLEKLSRIPALGSYSGIKLGREVDETRINERLCAHSPYRFVKGFMISCYEISNTDYWYYDSSKSALPATASEEKVVWRDVSRVSQKKRVQATLLPPGYVAGNSLGVATCKEGSLLRALLGVMNSSIFEFMSRTVLTTNHVSSGMLKRIPFPEMNAQVIEELSELVEMALENTENSDVIQRIESLVALAYDISIDELEMIQTRVGFNPQGLMGL